MRALQSFTGKPETFGDWMIANVRVHPLPWAWDEEETALLQEWSGKFGWFRAFQVHDPGSRRAASAVGALVALARRDCFQADGDNGVWRRLAPLLQMGDAGLAAGVTRLCRQLGWIRPEAGDVFVNLIPFLRLVGCPPQALSLIGQRLRNGDKMPHRFQEMIRAKWEGLPGAESQLGAWLQGLTHRPPWLEETDAALLQKEPGQFAPQELRWRLVEVPDGQKLVVIMPSERLEPGTWTGAQRTPIPRDAAVVWGVSQVLGQDGWLEGPGGRQELPWPDQLTFWRPVAGTLPGGTRAFEIHGNAAPERVTLPPGWSVDGVHRWDDWSWAPVQGRCALFAPDGELWEPGQGRTLDLERREGVELVDHPRVAVLYQLPTGAQNLVVEPGPLGSTLLPGERWTPADRNRLPPLGHVILRWGAPGASRQREAFVLPSLQVSPVPGSTFRMSIWGMTGLEGMEDPRWYPLPVAKEGTAWSAGLKFRGWGRQPLHFRLFGQADVQGGVLSGSFSNAGLSRNSPWAVSPAFLARSFRENLKIQLKLPWSTQAGILLEEGGPLWPARTFADDQRLSPLEFQDPLAPLLAFLGPSARPLRLSLVWGQDGAEGSPKLFSACLLRLYLRDRALGVKVTDGGFQVRSNQAEFDPSQWTLVLGSMNKPTHRHRWPLADLDGTRDGAAWHYPIPETYGNGSAPYYLQLVSGLEPGLPPLSLHVGRNGEPVSEALAAFRSCVERKGLGGVPLPEGGDDHRDRLLAYVYSLATQSYDLTDHEIFTEDEQEALLDHLEGDFLFSQPWSLAMALRHPAVVLDELARRTPDPEALATALTRLTDAGWTWWLVGTQAWERLPGTSRAALLAALDSRYAACLQALRKPMLPAVQRLLTARICEEGFLRFLDPGQRATLLKAMGFPPECWEPRFTLDELGDQVSQGRADGILGQCLREWLDPTPFPVPRLENVPERGLPGVGPGQALAPVSNLFKWCRSYRRWAEHGTEETLLLSKPWPKAAPGIFRHYAIPFTGLALFPR